MSHKDESKSPSELGDHRSRAFGQTGGVGTLVPVGEQRGLKHPETLEDMCELEGVTLRKVTLVEERNHAHPSL